MSRIAIIGAGLAGATSAYLLSHAGYDVQVYERGDGPAQGASGNALGLYNPRFFAEYGAEASFYASAFQAALALFTALPTIDYTPCGALHLITDAQKEKRFSKMLQSWPWGLDMMRRVDAGEASVIAGTVLQHDALFLPLSGTVSPQKLCAAYLRGIPVHYNAAIDALDDLEADYIIIACGYESLRFEEAAHLPLRPVRGQVSIVESGADGSKCVLCYGGYTAPMGSRKYIIGSSFERGADQAVIKDSDDQDNLDKLFAIAPQIFDGARPDIFDHRAGVRCAAPGHLPVIGRLTDRVLINSAHGSHGILSSIGGAQICRALIEEHKIDPDLVKMLSPARFK